jgi:hypothetical protein
MPSDFGLIGRNQPLLACSRSIQVIYGESVEHGSETPRQASSRCRHSSKDSEDVFSVSRCGAFQRKVKETLTIRVGTSNLF